MKTSLLLLVFAIAFSTNVFAKKVQISAVSVVTYTDGPVYAESVLSETCFYSSNQIFQASVHARKGQLVSLQLVTDTEARPVNDYGSSWIISKTGNWNLQKYGVNFSVARGQDWSLVWVLESTKGKGRIIDAREVNADTCSQP